MKALNFQKPHLLILTGIHGSGKTYFASHFSETFHIPFVCDEILHKVTHQENTKKLKSYFLAMLFKTNSTIILESDESNTQIGRTRIAKIAKKYGYSPTIIWVQTDEATANKRCKNCQNANDKNANDFVKPSIDEDFVVISGKHTYSTQLKIVLNKLSEEHRQAANNINVNQRKIDNSN